MLLWLFFSFVKVGLFSFGGGYCMIPLIEREIIVKHSWLNAAEFVDVVAIAEITPGPIAVNAATFVGYRVAGLAGSAVATAGVILPTTIIIIALTSVFVRYQSHAVTRALLYGLRTAVVALIVVAALSVGRVAMIDGASVVIFVVVLAAMLGSDVHPILLLMAAGVAGLILY